MNLIKKDNNYFQIRLLGTLLLGSFHHCTANYNLKDKMFHTNILNIIQYFSHSSEP